MMKWIQLENLSLKAFVWRTGTIEAALYVYVVTWYQLIKRQIVGETARFYGLPEFLGTHLAALVLIAIVMMIRKQRLLKGKTSYGFKYDSEKQCMVRTSLTP